eukprot:6188791-Prymnesium_polylepis.1
MAFLGSSNRAPNGPHRVRGQRRTFVHPAGSRKEGERWGLPPAAGAGTPRRRKAKQPPPARARARSGKERPRATASPMLACESVRAGV